MNIALMAHDNKKELMVQFCTAYAGILARHQLYATNTTGHMIADATGLDVHGFLTSHIATAEMLVLGLSRGDLDWRLIVNPSSSRPLA